MITELGSAVFALTGDRKLLVSGLVIRLFWLFSPSLCSVLLRSRLPLLLPPLVHHVCVVVLEDHLYQTFKPFQRGTGPGKKASLYISVGRNRRWLKNGLLPVPVLPAEG